MKLLYFNFFITDSVQFIQNSSSKRKINKDITLKFLNINNQFFDTILNQT